MSWRHKDILDELDSYEGLDKILENVRIEIRDLRDEVKEKDKLLNKADVQYKQLEETNQKLEDSIEDLKDQLGSLEHRFITELNEVHMVKGTSLCLNLNKDHKIVM